MPRLTNPSGRQKHRHLRIVDDTQETLPVPANLGALSGPVPRGTILALEDAIRRELDSYDNFDDVLTHHFAPGAYGREMLLKKGSIVVGKIHKHAHLNVLSQGDVLVVTEDGLRRLTAPATFVSKPGTKRCVYALAESVWTTVHVTTSTDLAEIEEEMIYKNYAQLDADMGKLLEHKP